MSTVDSAERQRVAGLALALVRAHEPALEGMLRIGWSARFTRRLGDATYTLPPAAAMARVRFSTPLWGRAGRVEQDATVAHEVAHLIVFHRHHQAIAAWGPDVASKPAQHGHEWRGVMRELGYKPERTHSVDRTGIARRYRYELLHCHACGKAWPVSPKCFRKTADRDVAIVEGRATPASSGYTCHCNASQPQRMLRTFPSTETPVPSAVAGALVTLVPLSQCLKGS